VPRPAAPSDSRSDEDLIAAANRGQELAMEALYWRYRDWVYSLALRLCGQREDAADVLQETFFYLFGKFPGFTLSCRMRTFLHPVVCHLAFDRKRKRRRAVSLEGEPEPEAPPQVAPEAERRALAELVADLPEPQRDVLLLRFADGLPLEEISGRLAVPLGTVKSRLHNALATLRRRLDR